MTQTSYYGSMVKTEVSEPFMVSDCVLHVHVCRHACHVCLSLAD